MASADKPLSVIKARIGAGNFSDNDPSGGAGEKRPTEPGSVTIRLQVAAPLQRGINTLDPAA